MAGGLKQNTDLKDGERFLEYTETFVATGVTDAMRFERNDEGIIVQVSGTATSFSLVIERATKDPNGATPNWAPADNVPLTGDLTVGVEPERYDEPVQGWWRARLTELTGGNMIIYIAGSPG